MVAVTKKTPTKFDFTPSTHPWVKIANGIATLSIPSDCANVCNTCVITHKGLAETGQLDRWLGYATGKPFGNIINGAAGVVEAKGVITFQTLATYLNNKLWAPNSVKASTVATKEKAKA